MRTLGIDYGDSRIGIAVSDPFGWTAQAVETVNNRQGLTKAINRIVELIKEYNINKIVVGFPRNMNGTVGPRGEKTLEFIDLLNGRSSVNPGQEEVGFSQEIEIIKWDERLTTVAANRVMHEMGTKTSKKKSIVDQIAAVYILQGYLDSVQK